MDNRAAVFMLKSVFKWTENPNSHETARKILLNLSTMPVSDELLKAKAGHYGNFMAAVAGGDFFKAYQIADGSNQDALAIGMEWFLAPEATGEASNLYDDGLEPSDYLPDVPKGE